MKKTLLALVLVFALGFAFVSVSSADLPGSGWWQGASFQNVGSGQATVVLTAYDSTSSDTYSHSLNIDEGASETVLPDDIPGLPSGFLGSIAASSDQPLAAQVNVTNRQAAGFGVAGGKAAAYYNGVNGDQTGTSWLFPLVKHNHFDKTTTFYLQNAGTSATTVDVDFHVGGTTYSYTTGSIDPGQMVAVDPGLTTPPVPSGDGNIGAMEATSSEPIAAVMLEHEHDTSVAEVLQGSGGFTPASLDSEVFCPLFKNNYFGRNSGMQVQNADSSAQDVTVTFVAQDGSEIPSTATNVDPGASVLFYGPDIGSLPGGNTDGLYSARVEGSAGNVAVVVNESELPLTSARQTSTTYACQGSAQATSTVSYPAYKQNWFTRSTGMQVQNVGAADASDVVMTFVDNDGTT
ncbi:MAG: hypothetical protein ACOC9Z_03805, partial [Chloroflexota bacterium]